MKILGNNSLPLEIQRCCDASKVAVVLDTIDYEYMSIDHRLLGLIDYYETIFKGKELSKKEYEFRNNKLSLILDLINTVKIPEDMMAELRSTIIAAWRLRIPGSTKEKRSGEISMVLNSIERLRTAVKWAMKHLGPDIRWQLDVAVLHSISLRRLDLEPKDVHKVQDLLNQAVEYMEIMMDGSTVVPEPDDVYFSAVRSAEGFGEHEDSLLRH
jgi:hypothetical protein